MTHDRDDSRLPLLRAIIEGSDDAIVTKTLDGLVTSWNPAAERMFGYAAGEMIGRPITTIFPADRIQEEADFLRRLSGGQRVDHYETVRVRKDGRPIDVSVTLSPLRDAAGHIIGASKIARDVTERKRLEAVERAQSQWRRAMLSSIGDAVIATDNRGHVTYMNPVAESLTGWKLEEATDRLLTEVFHIVNEHTRQVAEDPVSRVLREGTVVGLSNHTLLLARDRRERPIDDSAAPILDADDRTVGVVLVFRDVTERRRAEARLREREARFRTMADSAPVMIWMAGAGGGYEFFNRPWLEFTGRPLEAELGDGWAAGVHPEDLQRCLDTSLDAFKLRRPFRTEYRLRRHHGDYRWLLDTGVPRFEPDGGFAGYVGSCVDITERREAEAAIAEQREWFRVTLGSIGDAVIATDLEARVTFVNPVAEAVTGWRQEDALGQPLSDVFRIVNEQTRAGAENPVIRVLREGIVVGLANSTVLIRRDGTDIPIDDRAAPIRDASGRMVGVVLVFHDIVDRRRAEAERAQLLAAEHAARMEAERANRAKDEFLATVSHELRTPLNVVFGWARMLRTGNLDGETTTRALETIERNSRLQVQLIEDLLDVSRIVSGKLSLQVRRVDLAEVIDAARELVRAAAEEKRVRVDTELDDAARAFVGDPDRLQQVVWNLLSNAVRFTPPGGRVRITLTRTPSHVRLSVSDTGRGITADLLPHVFERFRQGQREDATPGSGLGLGLAIVRELVHLHGGTVVAFSEGEGRGATFVVSLPLREVSLVEGSTLAPAFPSLAGARLLVVEDDADARMLTTTILRGCGAEVVEVGTAREALEALAAARFDVLVSDIGLPDQDGYALMRAIRQSSADRNGGIQALAVTALARDEDRRHALAQGYQAHLAKPVEPIELATRVAELRHSARL